MDDTDLFGWDMPTEKEILGNLEPSSHDQAEDHDNRSTINSDDANAVMASLMDIDLSPDSDSAMNRLLHSSYGLGNNSDMTSSHEVENQLQKLSEDQGQFESEYVYEEGASDTDSPMEASSSEDRNNKAQKQKHK